MLLSLLDVTFVVVAGNLVNDVVGGTNVVAVGGAVDGTMDTLEEIPPFDKWVVVPVPPPPPPLPIVNFLPPP